MKKSPFGVRSIGLLLVCLLAGGSLLTAAEEIKSDPVFLPVIEKEQTEETEPAEVPAQEPDKAPVTEPIQVDKLEITASAAEPLPGETVKITVKITAKNQENSKLSPFIITVAAANGNAATKQFEEATVKNGEVWYEGGVLSYIYECTPLTEETTFTTVKAVVADAEKRYNEFASAQLTFGESPVEEPVTEEPAVEEPAVEEPAVEEPAVEEPAVEEPAVEEPVVEEPVVEEPVAEEPAAEEPVAEEETPASKPEVVLSMKTDKDPAKLNDGDELTLIAGVKGLENGTYSLRWQILENGNWSDIAGADGPEYKVIYSEAMKGCAFRFIVTENEVPAEEAPAEPEA